MNLYNFYYLFPIFKYHRYNVIVDNFVRRQLVSKFLSIFKLFFISKAIVQEKVNCNTNKRTSSAARLGEGNLIGERLADLGERKLLAKQKYWDQKCLF